MNDTTKSDLELKIEEFKTTSDLKRKGELGWQIGYQLILKGQSEEGKNYCDETLAIVDETKDYVVAYKCNIVLGFSYSIKQDYIQTKEYYEKAFEYAEKSEDTSIIAQAYNNLGANEKNIANVHGAIENYIKASNILSAKEDNNDFLVALYTNIGNAYTELKINDEALEYYRKAYRLNTNKDKRYLSYSLGLFHKNITKDFALALGYLKRSLKMAIAGNSIEHIAPTLQVLCDVYYHQEKYEKALESANRSLQYATEYEQSESINLSFFWIGKIHLTLNDYQKAEYYFDKLLKAIDSIKNENILVNIYSCLKDLYFNTERYREAYQYYEKYAVLESKIVMDDRMRLTIYETTKFETEQKKKDLEIYKLRNVELVKSQKIIEQKNEELIKTNEMKNNILGMISHDLKNYIGATLSAHELLIMKEKNITENKYVKMISDSSQKALALVKDILYMNKMEVDEDSLKLEKHILTETIDFLMDNLRLMGKRKNIEINVEYPTEPLFCDLNTDKFHRIIDNLVINAIKFTPTDGNIIVRVQKVDDMAHISIIDSGIGMDDEIRSKLFKQYSKAGGKGTDGEESTGLGLYIVKTLLDKHKATIEVFSEVGKGSEFLIKLKL